MERKSYSFLKKPASSGRGRPGGSTSHPVYEVESDDERCSDAGEDEWGSQASSAETAIVLSSPEEEEVPEAEVRNTFNLRKLSDALSNISQQDLDELEELESAIREGETNVSSDHAAARHAPEAVPHGRRTVSAEVADALRMIMEDSSEKPSRGPPSSSAPRDEVSRSMRTALRRHRGLPKPERPIYDRVLDRRRQRDEEMNRLAAEAEEVAARSRIGSRRLSPSEAKRIVSRLHYYGERRERNLQALQNQKEKEEADELARQGRPQISRKSRSLTRGRAPLLERLTRAEKYPPPLPEEEDVEATFRPVINPTSRALSRGTRSPSRFLAWEKKKQFRMQQALEEAAEEEMRECSFAPVISPHSRKLARGRTGMSVMSHPKTTMAHRPYSATPPSSSPLSASSRRTEGDSSLWAITSDAGGSGFGVPDSSQGASASVSTVIAYDKKYEGLFGDLAKESILM